MLTHKRGKVKRVYPVWLHPYTQWNYGGTQKRGGKMYRASDGLCVLCHDYRLYPKGLIYGVRVFEWVYEQHPTKEMMWWRVRSVR